MPSPPAALPASPGPAAREPEEAASPAAEHFATLLGHAASARVQRDHDPGAGAEGGSAADASTGGGAPEAGQPGRPAAASAAADVAAQPAAAPTSAEPSAKEKEAPDRRSGERSGQPVTGSVALAVLGEPGSRAHPDKPGLHAPEQRPTSPAPAGAPTQPAAPALPFAGQPQAREPGVAAGAGATRQPASANASAAATAVAEVLEQAPPPAGRLATPVRARGTGRQQAGAPVGPAVSQAAAEAAAPAASPKAPAQAERRPTGTRVPGAPGQAPGANPAPSSPHAPSTPGAHRPHSHLPASDGVETHPHARVESAPVESAPVAEAPPADPRPEGDGSQAAATAFAPRSARPGGGPELAPRPHLVTRPLTETIDGLLRIAARAGGATARITLTPPELGSVEIRLRVRGSNVVAELTADSSQGAQALGQSVSDLRRALEAQGLVVQSLDVRQAGADAGASGWQGRHQPGGQGQGATPAPAEDETEIQVAVAAAAPAGEQVDVLA
jgi:flagellar hook-length control protein FliK